MPTDDQALLMLVLFVLPGFLAVETKSRLRPTRDLSVFDKTALSVLFSALVHAIATPLATLLALYYLEVDPEKLTREAAEGMVREHPLLAQAALIGYGSILCLLGTFFGWISVQRHPGAPPVWAVETVGRITKKPWWQRSDSASSNSSKYTHQLSVLVKMKSGDLYAGYLRTMPFLFDELQRRDKFFSLERVAFREKGVAAGIKLPDGQVVLLNSGDVDAMWIGTEPIATQ